MTYSIIQKSQLEGALRLDAEYYQPEYLAIAKKLNIFGTCKLKEIAYITDGEHGSPIFDDTSGIRYFSAQHVKDCLIDGGNANNISKIIDDKNKRSRLKEGDVLLSTVGTIGFAGLVTKELTPANIDRHVARISLQNTKIDPEFLVAFLNSRYGRLQSIREATGNVQLNIFIDKIKELKIPKENNSQISNIVSYALRALKESKMFYQQAEDLLLEELGLNDFEKENNLFSIIKMSEVQMVNRIDAEYYQEKYQKLIDKITSQNYKKLGDLVSIKKGFEPGSEAYQEEGKPFIRVSNLTKLGINDGNQQYLNEDLYNKLKNDFESKVGDILLSKDATPGIAYAIKEPIDGIISSGILRLKTNKAVNPEYIAMVINSVVGKMQAERDAGGSIIAHWKPEQIKNILIPILPPDVTGRIINFVVESHEARKKSKELLDEAKRKVEELIEKGGESI